MLQQAEALLRSGNAAEAARLCKQLRKKKLDGPGLLRLEGIAAFMLGRHAEAAAALGRFVAAVPGDSGALAILGNVEQALGKPERAAQAFRRVLALEPLAAPIHYNLGNALVDLGDWDGAAASFERACALQPNYAKAVAGLALVATHRRREAEAIELYRRAIALDPTLPQAHTNLGNLLRQAGRPGEAVEAHGKAIALKPDFAQAHANLGNALQDLKRLDEAIAAHERAVQLAPHQAECHNNLGTALFAAARQAEACACYDKAVALGSDARARRNLLAGLLYRDDLDAGALARLQARFGRRARPAQPAAPLPPGPAHAGLRIGYLSSDLRAHPVAGNLLPVLRAMDRAAYPAFFYANVDRPDAVTAEFQALAAGWRDISGLDDAEAAAAIRADGIDILVSLAGHFDDNRPAICGHRAAPVQISFHDVATSGLAEMDYIIGDPVLLPRGGSEYFTETPLRVPRFYVADLPDPLPALRDPAGTGGPVFCCFNNPSKIGPAALALWGRILAALPESRLVLKYQERYGCAAIAERFRAALVQAGARPDQVEMPAEAEPLAAFLDRYNDVDFALDTFPFSGSTTSFQALCMGVPVITWPWPRMVSRWTAAIQKPLGLDDFAVGSGDDYVAKALGLAALRPQWRGRRAEIRARLAASPLCAGNAWARNLERLYRAVWRRHLAEVAAR